MKAYRISELKNFMTQLLGSHSFDDFLLAEASITTYNTFMIDGHVVRDFFAGEEDSALLPTYDFSKWSELRGLCFDLIKGKRTPTGFRFVLHLKPEQIDRILREGGSEVSLSDIKAFVLNIKYDGSMLTCITATAFHSFLPDKTPDQLWDKYVALFFQKTGISFEEI